MSKHLKQEFLLDPDVIFLNHGSFGACPRPVFETYQRWQTKLERQPVAFLGRRLNDPRPRRARRSDATSALTRRQDQVEMSANHPVGMSLDHHRKCPLSSQLRSCEIRQGWLPPPRFPYQKGAWLDREVRGAADIAATGIIPGAITISFGTLTYQADNEVPAGWRAAQLADCSRPIIATCTLGPLGALGGKLLHDMGFTNLSILEGGVQAWTDAGLPTQPFPN